MTDFPRVLTEDELWFDIDFGLKQIPRSLLRDWASSNELKSDKARKLMVTMILARFNRYQVRAPEPSANLFSDMGTK